MKFTYLLVNIFSVIVPFIFSFHPKIKFNKYFGAFFSANIISAFCFLIWDAVFTANGVWGFSSKYTLGIKLFNLPIEEILFFFCIPFACVFTYHCLNKFFNIAWNRKFENGFILFLSFMLLFIGLIHFEKTYTSATFISTGLMLLIFKFVFKVEWLQKIFSIYPILLIPFFIVNGILTGYGLIEPVVWYNNDENLSIRLLTIPIEDVVYGFELIILTIFIYEKFKTVFYKNENLPYIIK
jgi:lycopene cyclase domain-containing protein